MRGERTAGTAHGVRTNSRGPRGRCCVKRGAKRRSAPREASEIASDSLRRRREAKSPGTRDRARQHSGLFSLPNPGVPGQEKNEGWGTPSPFKPPSPRCLPTSSEPPCHRTSSSWKLPLGSAPRMPKLHFTRSLSTAGLGA